MGVQSGVQHQTVVADTLRITPEILALFAVRPTDIAITLWLAQEPDARHDPLRRMAT
jgi:hypothetical protein